MVADGRLRELAWLERYERVAATAGERVAIRHAFEELASSMASSAGPGGGRVSSATDECWHPLLLEELHHRLMTTGSRRIGGVARTPLPLAAELVSRALARTPEPSQVLDPACGGGVFLYATAQQLHDRAVSADEILGDVLVGVDIDPIAVEVTTLVLTLWSLSIGSVAEPRLMRLGDSLSEPWPEVDLVVGNPPFRSPVGSGGGNRAAAAGEGYADDSARFVRSAIRALRPGGTMALIVPRSFFSSRDAGRARREVEKVAPLQEVWLDDSGQFSEAEVRVGALTCHRGNDAASRAGIEPNGGRQEQVAVRVGLPSRVDATLARSAISDGWGPLVAAASHLPSLGDSLETAPRLGSRWTVVAPFREEYYAIAASTREVPGAFELFEREGGRFRPVITSGLIDPFVCLWGTRSARIAGRRWTNPCVDMDLLNEANPRVWRWALERAVPKVLVASQTAVIEAAPDPTGAMLPCTPVPSIEGLTTDELPFVLAALLGPVASLWVRTQVAGSGRSVNAVRIGAPLLRQLPLPTDAGPWEEASVVVRSLLTGTGATPSSGDLERFGVLMCRAYGQSEGAASWWMETAGSRLPAAIAQMPPAPLAPGGIKGA